MTGVTGYGNLLVKMNKKIFAPKSRRGLDCKFILVLALTLKITTRHIRHTLHNPCGIRVSAMMGAFLTRHRPQQPCTLLT